MPPDAPQERRRLEIDREDLLAEATALVERAEFRLTGTGVAAVESVVIGFRSGGAASVFFEQDPAYQFNAAGELRRAFVAGQLFKAQQRRIVALKRVRNEFAVQLLRHELDDAEQAAFLNRLATDLDRLQTALRAGRFTVRGQVPPDIAVAPRALAWLAGLPAPIAVAARPHADS